MGADQHIDWAKEAASALSWWSDAGVDVLVEDEAFGWLVRQPEHAPEPPAVAPIALPATLDAFIAGAKETKGSWWPDWRQWIAAADGRTVPATGARMPGSGGAAALCDAPGEYVRTR